MRRLRFEPMSRFERRDLSQYSSGVSTTRLLCALPRGRVPCRCLGGLALAPASPRALEAHSRTRWPPEAWPLVRCFRRELRAGSLSLTHSAPDSEAAVVGARGIKDVPFAEVDAVARRVAARPATAVAVRNSIIGVTKERAITDRSLRIQFCPYLRLAWWIW